MQIIVLGAHRSGTSVVTRLLNLLGAYFGLEGRQLDLGDENARGFWERTDVLALDEALLASAGCDWQDVAGFDPAAVPEKAKKTFDRQAAQLILELDGHRPWVVKEPRMCLVFPLWKEHLEVPVCVLAHRSPVQVAHSLAKRNDLPLSVGAALWERYTLDALEGSRGLPRLTVGYSQLMADPVPTVEAMHRKLEEIGVRGLRSPTPAEIQAFLDPDLQRQTQDPNAGLDFLNADQVALFAALEDGSALDWQELPSLSVGARETLDFHAERRRLRHQRDAARERLEHAKRAHADEVSRRDLEQQRADERQRSEQEVLREKEAARRARVEELEAEIASSRLMADSIDTELAFRRAEVAETKHVLRAFRARLASLEKEHRKRTARVRVVEQVLRDYESSRSFRLARQLSSWFGRLTLAGWRRRRSEAAESKSAKKVAKKRYRPGPRVAAHEVDIIVCVHNALDDVRRCLESVREHTPAGYHLILSNDGSDEDTSRFLADFADMEPTTTLIVSEEATGYTRAANRGLAQAEGQIVVLLNSDTIVTPGWLEGILECFRSSDGIGIVGPLSNNATYQSVPERYGADGDWEINELPTGWDLPRMARAVAEVSERRFPRVGFLNGFCYAIRRDVIDAVGIFDEKTFPRGYGEENDFSLRASAAGYELAIADQTYVWHAGSRSYSHAKRLELAANARGLLVSKHAAEEIDRRVSEFHGQPDLASLRQRLADFIAQAADGERVA